MAENFSHHNHWNEAQWQQEIRRDERRISCYLHELVNCLDLPEENALIYGQLAASTDLVPTTEAAAALRSWFFREREDNDSDDEDTSELNDELPLPPPLANLENLCTHWNRFCAVKLQGDYQLETLAVSCAFAKLFARTSDFFTPEEPLPDTLNSALAKQALRDLNQLTGMLRTLAQRAPEVAGKAHFFLSRLGEIRESIIAAVLAFHDKNN